jgi:hypothetical protein
MHHGNRRRQYHTLRHLLSVAVLLVHAPTAAAADQDTNVQFQVASIEARLRQEPLRVLDMEQARPLIDGDRSARVRLAGANGEEAVISAKWKPVGRYAQGFNNEPRYDLAAYALQKLFLDEAEYVVPPVVLRAMPLDEYRTLRTASEPTLRGTSAVLFVLSYWVENVTNRDPWDAGRFTRDTLYARHWANVNILTHIIDHKDSNVGNLLISTDPFNPRVFAVDNDVAFRSQASDVGTEWRRLHVNRLPAHTVERLRTITPAALEEALAVLAEFSIVDGGLVPAEPGANLNPGRGVRQDAARVQVGLTSAEIRDVERRIANLLRDVDRGRITTFTADGAR